MDIVGKLRIGTNAMIAKSFAFAVALVFVGCASERETIVVNGPVVVPGGKMVTKDGPIVHRTDYIGSRSTKTASVGDVFAFTGTGSSILVAKGGCVVERESKHEFAVVPCADMPPEGCLEGELRRNTVKYEQGCQSN